MTNPDPPPLAKSKPKPKRSRTGCNECRRIHRRCDESKPSCQNCLRDGKTCSYQRQLTWIAGGAQTPPRRPRAAVAVAVARRTAFPSSSSPSPPSFDEFPISIPQIPTPFLPWLSPRHRSLVTHFAHVCCSLSFLDRRSHLSLCRTLLPLATDPSKGFPLVAAILSVALTHRRALTGAEDGEGNMREEKEERYWETVAVGHLRRLGLEGRRGEGEREKEADEELFVATALLLSHRETFAGGERAGSWRTHLGGAMAVLRGWGRKGKEESSERRCLRRLAVAMHRVAQVFVRPSMMAVGTVGREKMEVGCKWHGYEENEGYCSSLAHFETCDRLDEALGVSDALMHTLLDVGRAAADMTALLHMERAAGPEGMEPLWASMSRRVQGLIAQTGQMRSTLNLDSSSDRDEERGLDAKGLEEVAHLNRAYYHITLSQINLHLMGFSGDSEAVQLALENAMACLEMIDLRDPPCPGVALLQGAFAIGCYACSEQLRHRVIGCLDGVKRKYGRGNAQKAKEFLWELWPRMDTDSRGSNALKLDWRLSLRTPHRGEEFEWTDLMAEKDWDLSLW